MTTPSSAVPTPPPSQPPQAAVPSADQSTAAAQLLQDDQIRRLVMELMKPALPFDPATFSKAVVTTVHSITVPRSVECTLSGDTTVITDVMYLDSYSPNVGDTVLVGKQGGALWVLGQLDEAASDADNGWVEPSLGTGFTTNGNANGNVMYRRIIDHGERKIQWRGGMALSGRSNNDSFTTMPSNCTPTARKTMLVGRNNGQLNDFQIDFNTDGTCRIQGITSNPDTSVTSDGSHGHSTSAQYTTDSGYTTCSVSHRHTIGHNHDVGSAGSHNHTVSLLVASPTWVSLNGVEYFLES